MMVIVQGQSHEMMEVAKIGPKIGPQSKITGKLSFRQNNSAINMLALSKKENEDLLKVKKLEKTIQLLLSAGVGKEEVNSISWENEIDIRFEAQESLQDDDLSLIEESLSLFDLEEDEDGEDDIKIILDEVHPSDNYSLKADRNLKKIKTDRSLRYVHIYGEDLEKKILNEEIAQGTFENCLNNHSISEILRAKMIDWMIEVFWNYSTSNDKTFFRAVSLLDQFFSLCPKSLTDNDVHLYGIACMLLASKQEDILYISLEDAVEKIGHMKFSGRRIREAESNVLAVLQMCTDTPHAYIFLKHYSFKCFRKISQSLIIDDVTQTATYLLKMCIHHFPMLKFTSHILALSVLVVAMEFYFESLNTELISISKRAFLKRQQLLVVQGIFTLIPQSEYSEVNLCTELIKDLFHNFEKKYPSLKNLDKFSKQLPQFQEQFSFLNSERNKILIKQQQK